MYQYLRLSGIINAMERIIDLTRLFIGQFTMNSTRTKWCRTFKVTLTKKKRDN